MQREWDPPLGSRVVALRPDAEGAQGVVLRCDRYGHFVDPYWRASVRWDSGAVEHNVGTVWLAPVGQQPHGHDDFTEEN